MSIGWSLRDSIKLRDHYPCWLNQLCYTQRTLFKSYYIYQGRMLPYAKFISVFKKQNKHNTAMHAVSSCGTARSVKMCWFFYWKPLLGSKTGQTEKSTRWYTRLWDCVCTWVLKKTINADGLLSRCVQLYW